MYLLTAVIVAFALGWFKSEAPTVVFYGMQFTHMEVSRIIYFVTVVVIAVCATHFIHEAKNKIRNYRDSREKAEKPFVIRKLGRKEIAK